eukprot:gene24929-1626_t
MIFFIVQKVDVETGKETLCVSHEAPVKGVRVLDDLSVMVTGGWDNEVRMWDTRIDGSAPVWTLQLSGPFVDMDIGDRLGTFAVAREFSVVDMSTRQEFKRLVPHNNMDEQIRCVGNFKDQEGFVAGGIDGRSCV